MFIDSLIADSWVCWLADSLIRLFGIPCFIDPLGHWLIASLLHWFVGPLLHWFVDSSTQYFAPSLIHWFTASLPHLTPRFIGCLLHRLIPCFVPSSIHWFTDSLTHWFMGSLVHWFIQSAVHGFFYVALSFHWHLNNRCSFVDASHDFITSLFLHLKSFPIGYFLPINRFFSKLPPRHVPSTTELVCCRHLYCQETCVRCVDFKVTHAVLTCFDHT
jgi:ABC-type multidrug transport system fused ATPase/permease subunit